MIKHDKCEDFEAMILKLKAENAKLKECLGFYSNKETWFDERVIGYPVALDDEGENARKLLKELEE